MQVHKLKTKAMKKEIWRNINGGIMELKNHSKEVNNPAKNEQDKKGVMIKTIDKILQNKHKLEDGHSDGFVYGIIPENGKPISVASENLHCWWKEKVRFDRNDHVVSERISL